MATLGMRWQIHLVQKQLAVRRAVLACHGKGFALENEPASQPASWTGGPAGHASRSLAPESSGPGPFGSNCPQVQASRDMSWLHLQPPRVQQAPLRCCIPKPMLPARARSLVCTGLDALIYNGDQDMDQDTSRPSHRWGGVAEGLKGHLSLKEGPAAAHPLLLLVPACGFLDTFILGCLEMWWCAAKQSSGAEGRRHPPCVLQVRWPAWDSVQRWPRDAIST
jgi:hypothetical protein